MQVKIIPPTPIRSDQIAERIASTPVIARLQYQELCKKAGVRPRVSGSALTRSVIILAGDQHFRPVDTPSDLFVGVPGFTGDRRSSLQAIEILAYGFLDYAAREAVSGRGLYIAKKTRGRKPTGSALSGTERARRARCRQQNY